MDYIPGAADMRLYMLVPLTKILISQEGGRIGPTPRKKIGVVTTPLIPQPGSPIPEPKDLRIRQIERVRQIGYQDAGFAIGQASEPIT